MLNSGSMHNKKSLSQHLQVAKKDVLALMSHVEAATTPAESSKIAKIIKAYKERLARRFLRLEDSFSRTVADLQNTIDQKNKQIRELIKEKDIIISDNYLLEYKKKDLMLLAAQLEEAYEEISKKNSELATQKKQIQVQAEEINQSNQKILKKNEELIELNTEKNNLIHIVAHDLKSPLNQIKGLISLIKFNPDQLSADSVQCLEMMDTSANRLNEMIAKILDVKAIEEKKLNINLEQVNLSALARECTRRYSLTADEKGIKLEEDIAEEVYAEIDQGFITQALENLLSNALKFSESNTAVNFKLVRKKGNVLIAVSDQGPGITEEDKEKLFKKFQKLSAQPTGNETSTGLGLSIVKKFVEAVGGEIWCESEAGKGATFFVKLKAMPVRTVKEEDTLTT